MKVGTIILIVAIGLLVVEIESRSQAAIQRRAEKKKLKRKEAKKQNGGAKDGQHHPDKNVNHKNDEETERVKKRLEELRGSSEASKSAGTKEAKPGVHPDDKRMMKHLAALQEGDSPSSGSERKKDTNHGGRHPEKNGDSPTSGGEGTMDSKHPKKGQHSGKESNDNGPQEGDSQASGSGGKKDPKHPDKKGSYHPGSKGGGKGDSPASGNGGDNKHKNENDARIKDRLHQLQGDKTDGKSEAKHPDRTVRRRKKRSVARAQERFYIDSYQKLGNGYQDELVRTRRGSKKKKSSGDSKKPNSSGVPHADIFVLGTATLEGDQPVTVIIEPNFKGRKMRKVRKKCSHKITKVFHPHHDIKQRYRKGETGKREKREVFNLGECNFSVPPNEEQCKGGTQVKKT
ncbi:hypothetical protein DdX_15355 [Ditylenchus destructor]|uniref:Uncharacterized protein n=1 Tax=Ditylenchus destructor TaxID=166010 RepID=A0AAD4R111_9BILA|nr:hypothetical protein DdX_15355 [Ditylenchus destructor]